MKLVTCLQRRYAWINLSTVTLITLLQRSPVVRIAADAEEFVATSPVGTLLKSAAAAVAALGAVNSMAGATILSSSLTANPSGPLPTFDATIGVQIQPLAFGITNTMNVGSWTLTGTLPPGLKLVAQENSAISLTAAGNLDATTPGSTDSWTGGTTPGNATTTPILEGTPTTAGTYNFSLQGFALGGEQGGGSTAGFTGTGISAVFPFTVVVAAASTGVSPPAFTTQPISVTVTGGRVALVAVGSNSPTYQWWWNNSTSITGATDPVLLIPDAASGTGSYTCVITTSAGNATSNPAVVSTTTTTDLGRLINLSCRAQVGTGTNIMTAGFVIGGTGVSGEQSVLVRGTGPTLSLFALTGVLADPKLTLNNTSAGTVVDTNTGWGGNPAIASAAATLGAFSWGTTATADSALLESLPPDNYTAQIAGASGDTGLALVEVYDATPAGTYTPTTPRMVNLSALIQVGSGANVVFAGFVVGGSASKTMLVRATGPTLGTAFGFSGVLKDPQLTLTNTSVNPSQTITVNVGWGGDAEINTVAGSVGAFQWGLGSADSAVLITLPPGNYTAGVAGASGDSGLALIELYEVD
jgi:hypothetical protein